MIVNKNNLNCWIATEGMAGTENQAVAVAEALGVTPLILQIGLCQPWKSLSPWLGFECACSFKPKLSPPWPDLLITAGRKSVAISRYVKKRSGGKTFTVQIQDPKISPAHFDLVAVPFHDKLRGGNVLVTDAAPNRLTQDKLHHAKTEFAMLFQPLPGPHIAVLIGGNSRTHKLTPKVMHRLVDQLKQLKGSLIITASRRTGAENLKILRDGLAGTNAFIWDGTGDNPYFGMLAWADHILVTADSVSMLSDAGTTGKPVYMIPLEGRSARFDKFHNHLKSLGVLRLLPEKTGSNLDSWAYEPLNDAAMIAREIERRLG